MRTPDQFWARVDKSDSCWQWGGSITAQGYGNLRWGDGYTYAHRVAYELVVGPIPAGLVIDHLCRNRRCVNPDHLEPVRQQVNSLRGAHTFNLTNHCRSGRHIITPENTKMMSQGRVCGDCYAENRRRNYGAMKDAAARLGVPISQLLRRYGLSTRAAERALADGGA